MKKTKLARAPTGKTQQFFRSMNSQATRINDAIAAGK
jgi:hypothetical protein